MAMSFRTGYSQEIRPYGELRGGDGKGGWLAQGVNRREASIICGQIGSGGLKERADQGRCSRWSFSRPAQRREDFAMTRGFDGSNKRDQAGTMATDGQVDFEDTFEQLTPDQAGLS